MAFTGTATVQQFGPNIVRITGVSLAAGASGIIALNGDTGAGTGGLNPTAIFLPSTFCVTDANQSTFNALGANVSVDSGTTYTGSNSPSLVSLLKCDLVASNGGAPTIGAVSVDKATGGGHTRITLTSSAVTGLGAFELYITFLASATR